MQDKQTKRIIRHKRIRAKISGSSKRPRLCVFKSVKHIYAYLIDDEKGKTLAQASDLEIKNASQKTSHSKVKKEKTELTKTGKVVLALEIGKLIADKAKKLKIEKVVFDRGGYDYHGKIKALASGAREGGLDF